MLQKFLVISLSIMMEICLATESPRTQFMTFINSQLKEDIDVHTIKDNIDRHSKETNADAQLSKEFIECFGPCFDGIDVAVTTLSSSEILYTAALKIAHALLLDAGRTNRLSSVDAAIAFFKSTPNPYPVTNEGSDIISGDYIKVAEKERKRILDMQEAERKLKKISLHVGNLLKK